MGELTFFLGLQVKQKEDGIFISQDKYVIKILKKFGFTDVNTANTPIETQKLLLKDEDGEEVYVHLYRSMIGSLMYLTSLRPDIMFAVYVCARYQVNPKVSHLYAMKRIFRYLKGKPKLGLWYLKDSPFDLVAYTDSDYAGASLDRKSTTRVKNPVFHSKTKHIEIRHHFIKVSNEKKLIQMIKIHTDKNVADLLTKAFDLQALVDRKKVIKTESIIRRDLHLEDAEGIDCLPNATIFKELTRMSAKTTAWNEFSSNMASAIICLATNKKFNFSKYIFESMVKNLDNAGKFLMYPRKDTSLFPTMMVQAQEEIGKGSANPTDPYHTPIITQPSTYQPQKKQSDKVADEAVNEEMDDNLERAATIATGLNADSGGGPRPQETMRDTIAQTRSENGRKIDDIDKDAEITLVDETHGLFNNEDIYLVNVYRDEDIFGVASEDVNLSVDELTLAQALAALKSAKPKADKIAAEANLGYYFK
ncbi:hypothetical protein Tco_1372345, partial [Tanacetum coccineum]